MKTMADVEVCSRTATIMLATVSIAFVGASKVFTTMDTGRAHSTECCFVATSGSDTNSGAFDAPFATLQHCVDQTGTAGGACYLRAGSYHEEVVINGKQNLLITNYDNEEVTFDGTSAISGWQLTDSSKSLYEVSGQSAWQLFVDGEPLALARYPNAGAWSTEAWNHDAGDGGWLVQADTSTPHNMVDGNGIVEESVHEYLLQESAGKGKDVKKKKIKTSTSSRNRAHTGRRANSLAAAGVSFNGCPVVLNTGHWDTVVGVVENHSAGGSTFYHADDTSFDFVCCDGDGRYFIEGCETALDTAGEWSYAANEPGRIKLMSPTAGSLGEVRGKVQNYAMIFYASTGIQLRGINFFATTFLMYETTHSSVTDCSFMYPSYHKRALNETHSSDGYSYTSSFAPKLDALDSNVGKVLKLKSGTGSPTLIGKKSSYDSAPCNVTISNNFFGYTSEAAMKFVRCSANIIENNYFKDIAYSAAGEYGALNFANSGLDTVRRNTFDRTGGSETIVLGKPGTIVEYNYFTYTGSVQSDGAAIHAYTAGQNMSIYRYNWVLYSPRGGFRFDSAKNGWFGSNGTIHHNVASANGYYGSQIKGWDHKVYHNVGTYNQYMDICLARCYPATCEIEDAIYPGATAYNNQNSTLKNNVGKVSSKTAQHTPILPPWTDTDVAPPSDYAPTVAQNVDTANLTYLHEDDLYMGASVGDWRPRGTSATSALIDKAEVVAGINDGYIGTAPDIGAYESGATEYWIPGRQTSQASMPVPFSASTNVNLDVSLMFLPGLGTTGHEVFFAKTGEALASVGSLTGSANIQHVQVQPGISYTWRVDALTDTARVAGPEWSFTTVKQATAAFTPSGDTYVYKNNGGTEVAGTEDKLVVFKYNSGTPIRMSFIKFDLSAGLGLRLTDFQTLGYTLSISSAVLKLYVSKLDIPDLTVWSVSDTTWDENTMNYLNMPALGETPLWSSTSAMSVDTWVSIPITISQLSGSVAFAFTTTSTGSSTQYRFASKESDTPPQLEVIMDIQ